MDRSAWVLYLKPPDKEEITLPSTEEIMTACKEHSQKRFRQIEELLVEIPAADDVYFASKYEDICRARIIGPRDQCLRLQKLLKERGFGTMAPDPSYVFDEVKGQE